VRPTGPRRGELGAEGNDQQKRQVGRKVDEQVQQLERSGIAPVGVLEHHQHRLPRRQPRHLSYQRLRRPLLLLLRGEVEQRVALAGQQ
jgi:hypothetical protein